MAALDQTIRSVDSILLASPLLRSCVCGGGAASAVREEQAARRYYVSGMVQGVGYRYFSRGAARKLGLAGYVRNLTDGRVEVYAIGPPADLNALRDELHRGPHSSRVSSVAEEPASLDSRFADQFSIEFDG
jgi:acylphosphatase